VAAARGRYDAAIRLYRQTVERLPLPQYGIALGDVLSVSGRRTGARQAYGVVDVIQRLFRANGVRTETETALFDLDHGRRLDDALARAREAERLWPSIYTQDVLAWAFYKSGDCEQARRYSRLALRLGTKDALKIFHRGMIELCVGSRVAGRRYVAQALEINPHFSLLYVPVAREALR
jgi:tetratricopeptide (TPR) repeat protein